MADNKPFEMTFELEKETKNTYRYAEMVGDEGKPPLIGTIYVQKWALGTSAPERLAVTLTIE